jgi:hypothetical protein
MSFIILCNVASALQNPNGMATHSIPSTHQGSESNLVDVLITLSDLPEANRETKMLVEIRVLTLIKCVVHTRKWEGVLTRNFVLSTVVNAQA